MNELLKVFLSLSLSGALLVFVLLLCKSLYKNKLSRQWQYYIWLVVIARLMLPFAPETNLVGNIFQIIDNTIQTEVNPQYEQNGTVLPETDFTQGDMSANAHTDLIGGEQPKPEIQPAQNVLHTALQYIWLVWLMGAIVLLIRKITVYQSFVKYIKAGRVEVSDIALWERFGKLVEQSGVKRTVGIYTNSLILSPLLIGFFRPCIMLPTTELSESDFQFTILHELTHYKRLDMFYK